jgi:hypothetical protein
MRCNLIENGEWRMENLQLLVKSVVTNDIVVCTLKQINPSIITTG